MPDRPPAPGATVDAVAVLAAAAPAHDFTAIMAAVLDGYTLPMRCDHGVVHWARVLENGLRIAEGNGADREIVALFAVFHDARRVNEYHDPEHGLRGGQLAGTLRGTRVHLSEDRFDRLFEACRLHTDGLRTDDPTIGACWDADRLDLGRVGIRPRPDRLCTDQARGLLAWANERAFHDREPAGILAAWGLGPST